MLRPGVAGGLQQGIVAEAERFVIVGVKIDPPAVFVLVEQLAFALFETVAVGGEPALRLDMPLQVGAIGEQCFAQVATFASGIDRRLVDPGAARVARLAGTAAEQRGAE
ncbi:hypothetical protein D3C80_1530070 [compost metagenome]